MTNVQNLPVSLRRNGLFCCWKREQRGERLTKVPYNPRTGGMAQSNNPGTFVPLAVAEAVQAQYDGLGVGIFGSLGAIDIDHCIDDNGAYSDMAADIITTMDSYTELSPSGRGVRILFLAPGFVYEKEKYYTNNQSAGLEVYIAGCTNKFVTVTGNTPFSGEDLADRTAQLREILDKYMIRPQRNEIPTAPATVAVIPQDDRELLKKIEDSRQGPAFRELWSGGVPAGKSHSDADMSLCNMLAWWTGCDSARMDSLFRRSGLMREKWDRKQSGSTYGAITIEKAIHTCRGSYDPKNGGTALNWDGGAENREEEGAALPEFRPLAEFGGLNPEKIPDFPVEAFPQDLCNYAVAASDSLQVSVDMMAAAVLSVISICAQRKFKVNPKPDWFEPVNLYTVTVAKPSERKSAVHSLAIKPILEYQKEENERRRPAVEEYRLKHSLLEQRIANMKKAATSSRKKQTSTQASADDIMLLYRELEDLELEAVDYLSLTAADITMEALVSKMVANGEKMALVSAEGGIFNILSGLYTGGVVNIDVILQAYMGEHIEIDRKGRPPERLLHPALTISLMTQPQVLEAVMSNSEFVGRGLNARFCYSFPKSRVGSRHFDSQGIPQEWTHRYCGLIKRLLSIPDNGEPRIIRFSPEAREELRGLHNWLEPRLIGELEPIEDWAGKYLGTVCRIVGLLHVMDHEEAAAEIRVPAETVRRASAIGQYYLANAQLAYQLTGAADSKDTRNAKHILKRLESTGLAEISKRNLFDLCRNDKTLDTVEKMEPALSILSDRGYIRTEAPQKNAQGGRPKSPMIYLNPEYLAKKGGKSDG